MSIPYGKEFYEEIQKIINSKKYDELKELLVEELRQLKQKIGFEISVRIDPPNQVLVWERDNEQFWEQPVAGFIGKILTKEELIGFAIWLIRKGIVEANL